MLVAVLLFAGLEGFVQDLDGDSHWHIALGEYSLEHLEIYTKDAHSHTSLGRPMFNPHWLADVALASAYRVGGYVGCYSLRAVAFMVLAGMLLLEVTRRGLAVPAGAALVLYFFTERLFLMPLRPEMFAFALFGILLFALSEHQRSKKRRWLLAPVSLFLLWPNVHASVGLGLFAIGVYCAQRVLESLTGRVRLNRQELALVIGAPVASFALACINPSGIWGPLAFRVARPLWVDTIIEWLPLPAAQVPGLLWVSISGVLLTTTAVALLARGRLLRSAWLIVVVVVLSFFAVKHRRFITWAEIASVLLVADNLVGLKSLLIERVGAGAWRWLASGIVFAAMISILTSAFVMGRLHEEVGTGIHLEKFPDKAARFLEEVDVPGPMFNSYRFGDYFLFKLGPDYPVFIDPRAVSVYSDELYARYLEARQSRAVMTQILEQYPVTWVVVEHGSIALNIEGHPRYKLVYFDDQAQIYADVQNPKLAEFVASRELRLLHPDKLVNVPDIPERLLPRALAELERQTQQCPGCYRTQLARAGVAIAQGNDQEFFAARDELLNRFETPALAYLAARHALNKGDTATADALFGRYGTLGGDPLSAGLFRAQAEAAAGNYDDALRILEGLAPLPGAERIVPQLRIEIEIEIERRRESELNGH